jgi:hypothetical protein
MSISPLDLVNQTTLVPNSLLGYSSNGESAIEITPTSITLGGDLNTTPIYVEVSASTGLTTNRVGGLNVNCAFDMNGNDITECTSVSNSQGNITISSVADDVNLSAGGGAICSINAGTTNVSASDILTITGTTAVYIEGSNDLISLSSANGIFVNDIGGSGGNGNIYANNFFGVASSASFANTAGSATNSNNILITTDDTSGNYYIPFSKSSGTGYKGLFQDDTTTALTYNPNTSTLSATTFTGTLNGTANSATNSQNSTITAGNNFSGINWYPCVVNSSTAGNYNLTSYSNLSYIPSTNTFSCNISGNSSNSTNSTNAVNCSTTSTTTAGTYYPVFVSNNVSGNYPNLVGTMTYNPSTNTITANTFSGLLSTGGLVYLSTGSQAITGSASATNISLTSIFNSTYKNYRIVLYSTGQVSFTSYPAYSLTAFLGTGTLPTTASLYGFEMTSASTSVVSPVYTASATISSSPLVLAVSQLTNHQTIIEVENVGFTASATQSIGLKCKSIYSNPGVTGASDRTISAVNVSGSTITGLTLQQTSISVGNNMTIGWTIYGYK